jgi:ADP-heptose:LPS heptosyltransferase
MADRIDAAPWPADCWPGPVLVVRLSSLGDVTLITGPLHLLRTRRPDLAIHVLTRRAFSPVLAGSPDNDRIVVEDEGASADPRAAAPAGEGMGERYACVLDWQGGQRGVRAAARFAPGVPRVTAPRASLERRLLVLLGGRMRAPDGFAVRLARSVVGAPVDPQRVCPRVCADLTLRTALRARLAELERPSGGWAILAPAASRELKAIPSTLVTEIATGLKHRGMGVIRLVPPGGSRDASFAPEPPWGWTFSGELPETLALLAEASAFVGSDSGILHLASGLGTPAVGLFGPTSPELGFSPLGRARAVGVELPCRPCHVHGPRRCWLGHRRCWRDFSAGAVFTALDELLDASAPERPSGTR